MRIPLRNFNPAQQLIHIQPLAAAKPPTGTACNGCGVCCLAEPCPLGVLLSRSRTGPCKALQWEASTIRYRCGALGKAQAQDMLQGRAPWIRLQRIFASIRTRLVQRWIAAGVGCDCDLEPAPCATIGASRTHCNDDTHD